MAVTQKNITKGNLMADLRSYSGLADDFKKRKMISRGLVRQHFAEPWQFRVEIDKDATKTAPALFKTDGSHHSPFDFLVKDVSFGPTEFACEPVEAGATVFTFPKSSQPVVISMTVRDTADRQLYKWFNDLADKVVNKDGTFNLPSEYLFGLTIKTYKDDDGDSEQELWCNWVYPLKMGDIQMSVDGEGFTEFPISFQQFRSLG